MRKSRHTLYKKSAYRRANIGGRQKDHALRLCFIGKIQRESSVSRMAKNKISKSKPHGKVGVIKDLR